MTPITLRIRGIPYGEEEAPGDLGLKRWCQAIEEQTKNLEPLRGECFLMVSFFLPPEQYSSRCKYGPELQTLVKALLKALKHTLVREDCGLDSWISYLQADKKQVAFAEEAGAYLELYRVEGEDEVERACALGVSRAWAAELTDPREDIYTLEDGEPVDGSR